MIRPARATALTVVTMSALLACNGGDAGFEVRGVGIAELQEAMETGRATSVGVTEAYLARIEAFDQAGPRINAVVSVNPNARGEAAERDAERARGELRGPMHGIPILLKDNYDTFDQPTSAGTSALAGFVPPDDAYQVRRLREAGAVILGKTNMHELAAGWTTIGSLGGQTLNPYDLSRVPGGSSGGTGAAVAASFAAVGWGSDTCGSIRLPSAYNNLFGLRPTKGLSSIDGIVPLAHTQDVGGPLARTARDLAIALDATVGPDDADPATGLVANRALPRFEAALDGASLEGLRVGIYPALFGDDPAEAEVRRLVGEAIARMVALGADTVTIDEPALVDMASDASVIADEFKWDLMDYLEASNAPVSSLSEMIDMGAIHEDVEPLMRTWNETPSRESEAYRGRLQRRGALRAAVEHVMDREGVDVLVYPTAKQAPARIGAPQSGTNCGLSAYSGLPALSMPVGFTADGLPIGMEVLGRLLEDARLVAIGHAFELATDHRREPESTPGLAGG